MMYEAATAGKADDGGDASAIVDLSVGAASRGIVTLQLTVWEQRL